MPNGPDHAVVVFFRPGDDRGHPPIVNEQGHYLGTSVAGAYFSVIVPPGDHTFVSCTTTPGVLRVRLLAGKRYNVLVTSSEVFRISKSALWPIRPGTDPFSQLDRWYTEQKHIVTDDTEAEKELGDSLAECARDGLKDSGATLDMLRPEDGQ